MIHSCLGRGCSSGPLLDFSSVVRIIQLLGAPLLMEIAQPCGARTLKCPSESCGGRCQYLHFQPIPLTVKCCLFWASSCLLTQSFPHPFRPHWLFPAEAPHTAAHLRILLPKQVTHPLLSSVLWRSPCPMTNEVKEEMRPKLGGGS